MMRLTVSVSFVCDSVFCYLFLIRSFCFFFFFFQAEDGIRDGHVTGVQTCALPIFRARVRGRQARRDRSAKSPFASPSRTPPIPSGGVPICGRSRRASGSFAALVRRSARRAAFPRARPRRGPSQSLCRTSRRPDAHARPPQAQG